MTRVSVTTNGGSKVSVSGQPNTQEIRSVGIAVSENYGAISDQANLAITTAQAAFAQANTGNATPAFNQANAAYILANNSYIFANTVLITAQGAFAQANAAPGIANSFSLLIGASSNTYATAVGEAGNSVSISIGTTSNAYATAVGVADNSTARAIGTSGNVYATSVGAAGNVYTLAAFNAANTAFAQGNNAYNFANTVLITAQAAFAQANAAPSIANTYATSVGTAGNVYASSVGVGANTYATAVGGAGNVYAVSVGIGANTYTLAAFSQANSAYILANNAYLFANTILPTAQGAFAKANGSTQLAFYRVNTAANNLTSSSNADILIVRGGGNIIVVGNTANQTLSIYDDQTTLIAAFAQANAAPGIANTYATAVGVADNSRSSAIGTAGNVYATAVGTAGNLYATSVGTSGNTYAASVGVGANTYALAAFTAANVANNLAVAAEGIVVSTRNRLNFIQGSNVSISIADDSAGNRVNVTISSTAGGGAGGNVVPAFDKANSAYTLASGALANTPGVTFNGSISFVGTSGIPVMAINTSGIISMSAYDTGNVGIGTTNPTSKLQVNGAIFVTQANTSGLDIAGEIAEFAHNINSYAQVHLRNASAGANASGDFVITADTGTDSTDYLNLGLNSSGYADPLYSITGPRDGYLYAQSQNLAIGVANTSPGKVIKFFTGGTTASNEAMRITATGVGIGTTTPANTLHVVGNANISSNLAVQGLDVYTHLQNTKTTGVTPGTYGGTGNAVTITVDATGRLSLASVAAAPIIRQHFVDVAMINTASQLQNWFPTLGNVTVATGTVYYVDARLYLLDTTTSHTVSLSVGGTAVVDWYNLFHSASTLANTTTPTSAATTTGGWSGPVTPISTAKVATVAGTTGHFFIQVQGLIAFAAGGTVRPAFSVSAIGAPVSGGVQNIKKGTYWSMSPVSANTANAIGPWGT